MLQKGFTLVELLIVIAIIGILAVGVLIALDPVEQTRRASDANLLQSASDVKNAIDRYYATKLRYPWCTSASAAGTCTFQTNPPFAGNCSAATTAMSGATCGAGVLTELVNVGELKSTLSASTATALNLVIQNAGLAYKLAFDPQSKAYDTNPNTATTNDCVTAGTGCTVAGNTCYYCL